MPAARASATASATSAAPMAPAEPPELAGRRTTARRYERRVTPAAAEAAGVAALVRPGLASSVTSASAREAEPLADALEEPGDRGGRQERRRAAAEVERLSGGRRGRPAAERGVERRPRAGAISASSAAQERVDPASRPARRGAGVDHEVAVRAERDAERDVDVERDRRRAAAGAIRPARGRAPCRRSSRRVVASRPGADDAPALGRAGGAARCPRPRGRAARLAGVAGREEDREAGDRVAEERRPDAAGDDVSQPPTRPMTRTRTSM